jgi:hypothetical protein
MRTDCTRDNRAVLLPNASLLGYGLIHAKRGRWVRFDQGPGFEGHHGRVIGRVLADGLVYVEIIALLGNLDCPAVRWINPMHITECVESPPRHIFDFICGEWSNPADILARVQHGFAEPGK